jgi:ankyrin repeat protein
LRRCGVRSRPLLGLAVAVFAAGLLYGCGVLTPAGRGGPAGGAPNARPAPARPKAEDLFQAAARGDLETVRAAVERSPGLIKEEDPAGWSAAAYAAWNGNKAVYDYLLARGAASTVFTEAALGPLPQLVQRLETNPRAADARDGRHRATALIWAVRTGNQAAVELLLGLGADVNAPDRSGGTALHAAVDFERLEIGNILISAGADPSQRDEEGRSPLHVGAESGQLQFCVLLVEAGAALDAQDNHGKTPLHLAAARGDFELCEYLLFLGASAEVRDDRGLTPGEVAREAGHEKVAALLRARIR